MTSVGQSRFVVGWDSNGEALDEQGGSAKSPGVATRTRVEFVGDDGDLEKYQPCGSIGFQIEESMTTFAEMSLHAEFFSQRCYHEPTQPVQDVVRFSQ
jgi:hypothetical protein